MNKQIKAGFLVLAILCSAAFVAPTAVRAASLSEAQIQAVVSLLSAFGVDAKTIANVNATLHGKATGGSVASASSSISVPGMTKYTDADFGFSFWYPSGWKVTENTTVSKTPDSYYPGGSVKKTLLVADAAGNLVVSLNEVFSTERTITDDGGAGPFGPIQYYFDTASHTWMTVCPSSGICEHGPVQPVAADVSNNTMGGVHMFAGTSRYYSTIMPLSAHNFVVAISPNGTRIDPLIKTIIATDPSVATPVSKTEQIATIQAEVSAYGVVSTEELMRPGESRPTGGVTPQCVSGYSVESVCAHASCVYQCAAIPSVPTGVTIDQSSLTSNIGNPVLSGSAGSVVNGSDLYVTVYDTMDKRWGSGNADPVISNGRWTIQVGAPVSSFRLPVGTYTVYVNTSYGNNILATGTLKILQ